MRENLIAGLDIGSSETRLVVGQRVETEAGPKLQIIGAVSVPSEGVNKGIINILMTQFTLIHPHILGCIRMIEIGIR